MNTIESMTTKMNELRKQLDEMGKTAVKDLFDEFFGKHPKVASIAWQQYVPYFNDGDPCVFTMGDIYFSPIKLVSYFEAEDYEDPKDRPFSNYGRDERMSSELSEDIQSVSRFLNQNQDILQTLFGDYADVVVTREGTQVQECEAPY